MMICSPQLGISPRSILGGEVFDREILLGIAKRGLKIIILLPKNKPHDQNVKNWQILSVAISHAPAFFYNIIFLPYIFYVYFKFKCLIFRIHAPSYIGFGAILLKLINPNIKLLAKYHQFKEADFGFLSKYVNKIWDHIICDSENVKRLLISQYSLGSAKITVVHNGVPKFLKPIPKDKYLSRKLGLENHFVLLYIGLFIERKNPLFLLKVLKRVKKDIPNVVLIFLGKGQLESKIINATKELGLLENIRIIPPVYGKEKNKIHSLSDIFVHPSKDEGFALAPLEAFACSKPVLMNAGHSSREAIEQGKNGYICKLNNIGDWHRRIVELLSDEKLRKKMGSNALQKARKEFQWKLAVDKHFQVLKNLSK